MSFALGREKALPDIPVDVDADEDVAELEGLPSPSMSKVLPSIKIENTLSEEEMTRLHELWNGAVSSARAHRRKSRRNHTRCRIPTPISIPEPGNMPPTSYSDPSRESTSPPIMGSRKRLGFLSAQPFFETREVEKKRPSALEKLRAMAQDRLKKKLRYAKSAPNLGDQAELSFAPIPAEGASEDVEASSPRTMPLPDGSATPNKVLQPEDMDENAIYFTIDPNWRASQGSVQFEFITPIPDSPTSFERPDSPLLHRDHSLDQLSSAAEKVTKPSTAMESEVYAGDRVIHLIDELHAYLEL